MSLFLLLACTAADPAKDSDPSTGVDTDTPTDTDTTDTTPTGPFTLTIPANTSSKGNKLADQCPYQMDVIYECDNPNPEVRWQNPPAGTAAFALVFDDPDAGDFDHWAVVNIPGDATGLDAGISGDGVDGTLPGDAYELENGSGFTGYLGSCPGSPHVYRWRLWALSEPLDTDLTRFNQVENQAEAAMIDVAEACHIYGPAVRD